MRHEQRSSIHIGCVKIGTEMDVLHQIRSANTDVASNYETTQSTSSVHPLFRKALGSSSTETITIQQGVPQP